MEISHLVAISSMLPNLSSTCLQNPGDQVEVLREQVEVDLDSKTLRAAGSLEFTKLAKSDG